MTPDIAWHTQPAEQVALAFSTDIAHGLGSAAAADRLARHGPNSLAEQRRQSLLAVFLRQFKSLVVGLLVAATALSFALGDILEALAILVVILLNAIIGTATEWQASSALAALRKQAASVARVVRDGSECEIAATDLVPGDIALLAAGDRVPADGRIISETQLQVDESALTGESVPVAKSARQGNDIHAPLGDRIGMVYMGSLVADGRARLIVTATGGHTEMGRIGAFVATIADSMTPIEAKLAQIGRVLLAMVLAACALIVLVGWLRGVGLLAISKVAISLAIAAVPEGLVAVTTLTLAVGMQRMARMKALIRRLPAVETLGSVTVICSDKTGTLTRNEMTVSAYETTSASVVVTGAGYDATGEYQVDGQKLGPEARQWHSLRQAVQIGALCNDTKLVRSPGGTSVLGDPTEAALVVAAEKLGLDIARLDREYPRVAEVPFSSETLRMATVHRTPQGGTIACVKGAPAAILDACVAVLGCDGVTPISPDAVRHHRAQNDALAGRALRVLGLAYRDLPDDYAIADVESGLTFVGLVGMIDPLRDEARQTIAVCREAGIRVIMITGDQEATASEIARQLGLDTDAQGRTMRTVHARELTDLDSDGWLAVVADTAVFARASPEHKLRIIEALQQRGNIVAMTGDGVNDAPALKKADIGIAMGLRGSEVAKEAADMVITDDSFATIVGAVEQGRIIVNNIRRFLHYLFSCNLGEIALVFTAIMIGWPLPLGVLQILWINLVTDIFPAMALALEPSAPGVMQRPPRDPDAPLITPGFAWLIVWQGLLIGGCALLAFGVGLRLHGDTGNGLHHANTIAFMTLALAQTFHAFNARSQTASMFTTRLFTNAWLWAATLFCLVLQLAAVTVPFLQRVLKTVPLTVTDWGLVLAISLLPVVVVESVKLANRTIGRPPLVNND